MVNEWRMKECLVKEKKKKRTSLVPACCVCYSLRVMLPQCPWGTPRHNHSLLRPPGQTSVATLCCNLLTGKSLP